MWHINVPVVIFFVVTETISPYWQLCPFQTQWSQPPRGTAWHSAWVNGLGSRGFLLLYPYVQIHKLLKTEKTSPCLLTYIQLVLWSICMHFLHITKDISTYLSIIWLFDVIRWKLFHCQLLVPQRFALVGVYLKNIRVNRPNKIKINRFAVFNLNSHADILWP